MLGPEGVYSAPVDMWAVGCIFGEMLGCQGALFPGKNHVDEVSKKPPCATTLEIAVRLFC